MRISRTVLRGAGGEIPRPTHHLSWTTPSLLPRMHACPSSVHPDLANTPKPCATIETAGFSNVSLETSWQAALRAALLFADHSSESNLTIQVCKKWQ